MKPLSRGVDLHCVCFTLGVIPKRLPFHSKRSRSSAYPRGLVVGSELRAPSVPSAKLDAALQIQVREIGLAPRVRMHLLSRACCRVRNSLVLPEPPFLKGSLHP